MTKVLAIDTFRQTNQPHEVVQGQVYVLKDSLQTFLGLVLDDDSRLANLTGSVVGCTEDLSDYTDQLIPSNLVDEITIKY